MTGSTLHLLRRKSGPGQIILGGCMNIPEDPVMLLSFVNMKLRDSYSDPEMLAEALNLDLGKITDKLAAIDYHYNKESNQFK